MKFSKNTHCDFSVDILVFVYSEVGEALCEELN